MAQPRTRLSAETWATAALEMIVEAGVGAVAVEPLAARLGATKGSFYWHFANRAALITAALELWEERYTEAIIRVTDAHPEPARRLEVLFAEVMSHVSTGRGEMNLLAAADHPLVGPVVRRVAARRVGYLVELFHGMGFSPAQARRRGLLAYQAYLGYVELAARLPELLPTGAARRRHIDMMLAMVTAPIPGAGPDPDG